MKGPLRRASLAPVPDPYAPKRSWWAEAGGTRDAFREAHAEEASRIVRSKGSRLTTGMTVGYVAPRTGVRGGHRSGG